ncbi:MAG TPA: hypothetical protein VLA36_03760 [Longimicrobiales bacterium]|nr:hypothetical protein [Longimicrobiales bacterium]
MITVRSAVRPIVATLGLAVLTGCYNYIPVERPSPGTTVRVHVPLRSAVQASNAPTETLSVEGVVVSDGDSLIVATKNRREFGAFREVVEVDTLRVARSGISFIEQQVFSKRKTYGMAALATAGAAGLVAALVNAAGGQRGDGPPGNTGPGAQIRVRPIFQGILGLIGR